VCSLINSERQPRIKAYPGRRMKNKPPANFLLSILIFDIQSAPLGNTSQFRCIKPDSRRAVRPFSDPSQREKTNGKTVARLWGVFCSLCLWFAPNTLALISPTTQSRPHCSGVIALYFGFAGSLSGARGPVLFWNCFTLHSAFSV